MVTTKRININDEDRQTAYEQLKTNRVSGIGSIGVDRGASVDRAMGANRAEREDYSLNAVNPDQSFVEETRSFGRVYSQRGAVAEKKLEQVESDLNTEKYYETVKDTDLIPSSTTMQFKFEDDDYLDEDYKNGEKASYKISARGKLLIVVYALVVATLIALITINSQVLKAMDGSIRSSEESVIKLTEEVEGLNARLAEVSDPEQVSREAEAYGMTK